MSESGFVSWPAASPQPLWTFSWQLMDGPDDEGIAILDAFYKGRQVFAKGSLAGFRTHYPPLNRFGQPQQEYKIRDDLPYNNARPHDELMFQASPGNKMCPSDRRVCGASVTSGGQNAILLQTYYCKGIGCYRLTQQWIFWADGTISPRIYSMGIQHNEDHSHHAYWRFDFSIDGPEDNQVLALQPVSGMGAQWVAFTQETVAVKTGLEGPAWAVRNKVSNRGYYIYPGPHDGTADVFAQHDLWVMLFHADEDSHGDNFTKDDDNLMVWVNNEDVDGQHVVVWYCSHLFHQLPGPADEWHGAGPDLVPFLWDTATLKLGWGVPGATHCHVLSQNDSLDVIATVSDLPPFQPIVNYAWTVTGAQTPDPLNRITHPTTLTPDGLSITDITKLKVTNLTSDVMITCNVNVGGTQLSQSIHLNPLQADLASREEALCNLVEKLKTSEIVQGLINPLGPDNPLDLGALLSAPGGFVELNRIANRLVQITRSPAKLAELSNIARDLVKATNSLLE